MERRSHSKRDSDPWLRERAKELRRSMTPSEKRLWRLLKHQWQGYKWRREEPLQGYIVDFLCYELMLVIEVDGSVHQTQVEYDEARTAALGAAGFHVVRVTNQGLADVNSAAFENIWNGIEFCIARKAQD